MDRPTILIIEDNADIRETLRILFEIDGYTVLTASHGAEGLAILSEHDRPCLIFLDLMMPVMDGWTFLEILRRVPGSVLASLPVTVVSGVGDTADARSLADRFGVDVTKKPLQAEVLLQIARQHCGPSR